MDVGTTINPKETPCRLLVGVNAKNLTTLRMGYTRIERLAGGAASFAALRREEKRVAYDADMPDARGEYGAADGYCEGAPTKR